MLRVRPCIKCTAKKTFKLLSVDSYVVISDVQFDEYLFLYIVTHSYIFPSRADVQVVTVIIHGPMTKAKVFNTFKK